MGLNPISPPDRPDLSLDAALDADGHLQNHLDWTPELAAHMAARDGLALTDRHWAVLQAVRRFYRDFGHIPPTRPLLKYLMQQLGADHDNAALMQLFATGRVARTVTRLAGVPKPPNCL